MKIMAIGDIHLGNYRFPIKGRIQKAMYEILQIAHDEKPDLTLIAGDVFNTKVPASSELSIFGWFLDELNMPVLMIPGNHDILSTGLTTLHVYKYYSGVDLAMLPGIYSYEDVQILAIPWLPQRSLSSFGLDTEDTNEAQKALISLMKSQMSTSAKKFLLAHATALGTEYRDGVSTVLGTSILWTNDVFDGFDASFLGHIHGPKTITDNAFYVGSICPLSFNEVDQEKRVIIWEDGHVHNFPLETPRFATITGKEAASAGDEYANHFIKILVNNPTADIKIPECLWHEVVTLPKRKELRLRLHATEMDAITAITAWIGLEHGDANMATVIEIAKEILRSE